jgi:hypothetical protein
MFEISNFEKGSGFPLKRGGSQLINVGEGKYILIGKKLINL